MLLLQLLLDAVRQRLGLQLLVRLIRVLTVKAVILYMMKCVAQLLRLRIQRGRVRLRKRHMLIAGVQVNLMQVLLLRQIRRMAGEAGRLIVIRTEVRYHVLLRRVDLVVGRTVGGLLIDGGRLQLLAGVHAAHQIAGVLAVRRLIIATVITIRR